MRSKDDNAWCLGMNSEGGV